MIKKPDDEIALFIIEIRLEIKGCFFFILTVYREVSGSVVRRGNRMNLVLLVRILGSIFVRRL